MDVSIIIVNYNTRDLTLQCLRSVYEKTKDLEFETIVVDNASADDSVESIKKQFPQVRVVESRENLGFGRANNLGLTIATGRNILFLNSDTELVNNAVRILSEYLDAHADVAVCGGNLYSKEMLPTHSFLRSFPSIKYELNQLFVRIPFLLFYGKNREFNYSGAPICVKYITGADLMIKKKVLDEVGGFDPDFFMYYEETELCFRANKAGYKIISVPDACIVHLGGASFADNNSPIINEKKIKIGLKSRSLFYAKTRSKLYLRLANCIFRITIWSRLLYYRVIGSARLEVWKIIDRVQHRTA